MTGRRMVRDRPNLRESADLFTSLVRRRSKQIYVGCPTKSIVAQPNRDIGRNRLRGDFGRMRVQRRENHKNRARATSPLNGQTSRRRNWIFA
jgi:hypothetical protein